VLVGHVSHFFFLLLSLEILWYVQTIFELSIVKFVKVLNLFLALLLASFGSNVLSEREKEDDDNKIGEAIDRIQRCFRFIFHFIFRLFFPKKREKIKIRQSNTNETIYLNQVRFKSF
jgi:hypothetical protein